jgi:RNA polymerase sigma factor (sigma-70 family)
VAVTRPQPWVSRADTGEQALVVELERREGQALFGFVRRLGLTDGEAKDVVQEVFLRLWRQLGTGRPLENPKGWMYRTVYRLAMDVHRLHRRTDLVTERLGHAYSGGGAGDARDHDDRIALWIEVDLLPQRQREVIYLRYRSDLPFAEIGKVLGITSSAARSHATQAMASLRRRFDGSEGA